VSLDETAEWVESSRTTEYARSKYEGELEVYRGIAEGLDAVVLNPSLVFGTGREKENTMQIIRAVRDRRLPAVPVGGTNVVDVEDVVDGHLRALSHGATGERYILGSENLSWRAIIDAIAEAFGVRTQPRTVSPRVALALASAFDLAALLPGVRPLITRESARQTAATYVYDNTRGRTELGCSFRPFAETLRRMAADQSMR
jgi:dihydroflavonol-4-reductase